MHSTLWGGGGDFGIPCLFQRILNTHKAGGVESHSPFAMSENRADTLMNLKEAWCVLPHLAKLLFAISVCCGVGGQPYT